MLRNIYVNISSISLFRRCYTTKKWIQSIKNLKSQLSLSYKVLATSQPDYLHNLISLFSLHVEPAPHLLSSQLDHLYLPHYKSPTGLLDMHHLTCTCEISSLLYSVHCPGSPHPAHITSSQSPPLLSLSVTPSAFFSRLRTYLFDSFTNHFFHSHSYSFRTAFTDL